MSVNVAGGRHTHRGRHPGILGRSRGAARRDRPGRSSVFAHINGAGAIPYAMSKAAIEQLGRGLRGRVGLRTEHRR